MTMLLLMAFGMLIMTTGCQDTYTTSAKVYMQQSNYDKAIEQSRLAVEQIPNNFEAYYVLGQAYGMKGMYREMNDAFNKSLAISQIHAVEIQNQKEKFYTDLFNLGVSKIREQKLAEAAEKFKLATEILPKKLDGYKNLAYTYTQMNNDSMAADVYKNAIAVDSNDVEVRTFLGILYYRDKKYDKCIPAMEGVLAKADPKSKQYADALYYKAYSHDLLGQTDNAIQTYMKALESSPNDRDLMFNLGRLYYMQTNYAKALEYFQKVRETDPEDFDVNMNIGNSMIQLKKHKEAIPFLVKAAELKPENAGVWYNLAVAYINSGDSVNGKEAFAKAEALKKNEK
jgi:tetratricopeptide (TPR) repeat protein